MDCPPAQPTASALRRVVSEQWLAGAPNFPQIIIATPSRATDAWMLIALHQALWPRGSPSIDIECDDRLDGVLISLRLARRVAGRAKKRAERYVPHLSRLAASIAIVRTRCPEAEIFLRGIADAVPG